MKKRNKKTKHIKKKIFLAILLLIVIYLVANAISIWKYGETDEKKKADVAIVLGAATANSELSPVFRERINHGIWLYENGYVGALIITGGISKGNDVSDAYVAKQYAVAEGISEEVIFIEEKSTITQENIKYAKQIMDDNGFSSAIIVSDPLHMKRAMLMAEDYGITAYSSPTPTTRYVSIKNKIQFLAREEFFYIGYKIYRIF